MVRNGLKLMLKNMQHFTVDIDECSNGFELLEKLIKKEYDIILLDISMPVMDGLDTLKKIRDEDIQTPVVILTMHTEESIIRRSYELGARAYISKASDEEELSKAINFILKGQSYYSSEIAHILFNSSDKKAEKAAKMVKGVLTNRELEVLRLIIQEKTNQEIADDLFLSKRTVEGHRERIMNKLGIHSTIGLVKYAISSGISS